jgi:Fe2+ transport system protein FeoA
VDDRTSQAQRLRELGLLEGRTLRIVTNSDPLICQVGECRLGVCRRLARCVLVEPVNAA